jgi:glycosyltransferase involved in cell wall biosynthesis
MSGKEKEVAVSVVIPTWRSLDDLQNALQQIDACTPAPAEVLVHVDGGDDQTKDWLRKEAPQVRLFESAQNVGPGGGRNILIEAARNEFVASFDDDSYPIDNDYFARLVKVFYMFPDADLIASSVYIRDDYIEPDILQAEWAYSFIGCGCAYRRSSFMETTGYLELPLAYGAEEQDLALRWFAQDRGILKTDWLRVYHDTAYENRKSDRVRAAWIANTALMVFLRYPAILLPYGLLQVINAMVFALKQWRPRAILYALRDMPEKMWNYRRLRSPLSTKSVWRYLQKRSDKESASWPEATEHSISVDGADKTSFSDFTN